MTSSVKVDEILISRDIFRSYDIRGVSDSDPLEPSLIRPFDLTARQAWLVGKAFGTWIQRSSGSKIVVGRDNRRTSLDLSAGFILGALSTGCQIIDIGLSTSPMLYFAINELNCNGGLMVTGSHNPMWSNGLKLSKTEFRTLVGSEIQELYQIIEEKDFITGEGSYRVEEVLEPYLRSIKARVKPAGKSLKVVVDTGNATAGLIADRILTDLGYKVVSINADLIYPFPNGAPDPEQPNKVKELGKVVQQTKADVGVAFDGDADRVGIVDELGKKLESDLLVLLLARTIISERPGAEIVFDVKCSDVLIDDISSRGGVPVMWKTGHSNIKERMADDAARGIPALLGGELSGHIFFRDRYYGFDDAIYASCRILEILSHSDLPMSKVLIDIPELKTTRELAILCPDHKKDGLIKELQDYYKKNGYDVNDIDGVRISFGKNKWALVRASNTQPKLTARFQAGDFQNLEEIANLIRKKLQEYDYIDISDLFKGIDEVDR